MFALGFPVVLYFAIAAPNRDVDDWGGTGIPLPLYLHGRPRGLRHDDGADLGRRADRHRAHRRWTRQLRVTPLSGHAYLRAKVATCYAMALLTMAMLYGSGLLPGVSLPPGRWLALVSGTWPAMGWIVVGAWSVTLILLARAAYRRDTARV